MSKRNWGPLLLCLAGFTSRRPYFVDLFKLNPKLTVAGPTHSSLKVRLGVLSSYLAFEIAVSAGVDEHKPITLVQGAKLARSDRTAGSTSATGH